MKAIFLSVLLVLCACSSADPLRRHPKNKNRAVHRCDVGIIGAGISGLYMAFEILKNDQSTQVCILEKDETPGGRLHDFRFKEAPNIDVGLGAWRIDKKQDIMLDLVDELGIKVVEWTFEKPTLYESRGVKADNGETIKTGYPTLLADPVFGHMTSGEMMSYALKPENVAKADQYATVDTYFSNIITPEGAEYIADLSGYKGDFTEFDSPKGYIEYMELSLKLSDEYVRPIGGMSVFIDILSAKVKDMGGKIFTSNAVRKLKKQRGGFVIITNQLTVRCEKLVVATPPAQFRKIIGDIAEQLQDTAEFNSILPIPAVKAAAVYANAWWEDVNIGGSPVKDGQKYLSLSNCLGMTMPHRGRGDNGEAVLHTMYADGACSRTWADIASLGEVILHTEIHRALEMKFGQKIPPALNSTFHHWESAWHNQKAGTFFTMVDISNWAKRPFAGEDVFVVGEAYNPSRGWCEGAITSCHNALNEGWGIAKAGGDHDAVEDKRHISEIIRFKTVPRA